jgi:hypothetical protein
MYRGRHRSSAPVKRFSDQGARLVTAAAWLISAAFIVLIWGTT